ncbi:hypothetical protein, partial [Lutibacter sp.]|uniref:hypothetical protein n=1 Tax=Lutibacter sp. TaxID=1925666 RepID=UPI00349FEFE2
MKKYFFLLLIIISQYYSVVAQIVVQNNNETLFNNIHQEKIFVHFNSSFLLTGETFYYKLYCLNSSDNTLSGLSKIAYVALIDNELNEVFKQKVTLESGLGQGDFFIPTSIKSGNYKIVAYTQWMRNAGNTAIFSEDISIVNPFNENQNAILSKAIDTLNLDVSNNLPATIDPSKTLKSNFIELNLPQSSFKNREKVILQFESIKEMESFGSYSISVRKVTPFRTHENLNTIAYSKIEANYNSATNLKNKAFFLPELRGELISGIVVEKDTNLPAEDVKVSLSIAGKDKVFKMATTNNLGQFYFNLSEKYKQSVAIIQLLNSNEKYSINIITETPLDYSHLKFSDYKITKASNKYILQQSINNQIENAYGTVKASETVHSSVENSFYNSKEISFNLDDFTRFPTVKETIVEIVDVVTVKQRKGNSFIEVIWANRTYDSGLLPLVIFDGIIIQDHNEIINYNANKIQTINVVREKYLYGTQLFEGIISFSSINGDFSKQSTNSASVNLELLKPLEKKIYFKQVYGGSANLKRIPDFRTQLLWLPNVEINSKTCEFNFFTSDVKGTFEISVEGFT